LDNVVKTAEMHRIIWCMYIPDTEEVVKNIADDASKVFVVTTDKQVDIYHLDIVQQNIETVEKALNSDDIEKGHLRINEHHSTILTASFSPDGSAIATACMNGEVNFYKLSFDDTDQPICLQKWKPHDSKAVTSLYFLDDHKNPSPNAQFWSYILTGCDYNREIKLWCCIKWQCLQTIRFTSDDEIVPCLKTAIDLSSNYFVMSDINRKVKKK
jgi:enhancer of mRNA-decapping protein 4